MELEEIRKQKAQELFDECVELKREISRNYLSIAKRLATVQEEKLYHYLGHNSMASFGYSAKLSVPITTNYDLIGIYKRFLVQFEVPEERLVNIGKEKLIRLLPVVNLFNHQEWLSKAEEMKTTELTKAIKEWKKEEAER